MDILDQSWQTCWQQLKACGNGLPLKQRLLACYREPQRSYHTVRHLKECLDLLQHHASTAQEPAEIGMALWFHDAVYVVHRTDNESRSAQLAADSLGQAEVAPERIARIVQLIVATEHARPPSHPDQELMVDIDLAILGAERPRYLEYDRQIRQEYSWVPTPVFLAKRRMILADFLCRTPLFHTPALQRRLEQRARANLTHTLGLGKH